MNFKDKKILIIHDRFMFRGGGERLVLDLAKGLGADIATEFWLDTSYSQSEAPGQVYVLDSQEPKPIVWRYFRAQLNFLFKTKKIVHKYNLIIFSGNNCLTASFNLPPLLPPLLRGGLRGGVSKIVYVHHPVRYVYDLLHYRRSEEPVKWKKVVYYDIGKWLIRGIYRAGLARMNIVIANSRHVRQRLLDFCQTEAQVIYPPIQINKFTWRGQKDYYLSFARHDELKRTIDIVRAFQQMPDHKLKVASGGPLLDQVRELAKGYDNIEVLGIVSDLKLQDLIGNCIAVIYIPCNEDFGMSPVEGMAAGKPCIGVNEGGLRETIIEGQTGILIPTDYSLDQLISAVKELTPEKTLTMKQACINMAQKFSYERFIREMKEVVEQALVEHDR